MRNLLIVILGLTILLLVLRWVTTSEEQIVIARYQQQRESGVEPKTYSTDQVEAMLFGGDHGGD